MSTEAASKDPSMDEILQSIKRIISEESDDTSKQDEDVLELTDMVTDDGSVVNIKENEQPEPEAPAAEPTPILETVEESNELISFDAPAPQEPVADTAPEMDILDKIDNSISTEPEIKPEPEPEPVQVAAAEPEPEPQIDEKPISHAIASLVSAEIASQAASSIDAFAKAVDAVPPTAGDMNLKMRDGTTVEDLVIEAIRPKLNEWLDKNLMQVVESVIQRELRRISGR